MNIGGGIAFGLVAALCWGVADFCARGSARTGGTFLTLFYVEIIATLGMLALNLPLGLISFAHATPGMVALPVFGRGAVRPAAVPRGCIARGWVARPGAVRAGVVRAGVARPWPAGAAGGASGPGETRPGM